MKPKLTNFADSGKGQTEAELIVIQIVRIVKRRARLFTQALSVRDRDVNNQDCGPKPDAAVGQ